jgi:hypothetical protein
MRMLPVPSRFAEGLVHNLDREVPRNQSRLDDCRRSHRNRRVGNSDRTRHDAPDHGSAGDAGHDRGVPGRDSIRRDAARGGWGVGRAGDPGEGDQRVDGRVRVQRGYQ